jgi:hypothetical protein
MDNASERKEGEGGETPQSTRNSSKQKERNTSYSYDRKAIISLVTSKFVTSSTDPNAVSDWTTGITRGTLDGAIRNELEHYPLEWFLDPIATLDQGPGTDQPPGNGQDLQEPTVGDNTWPARPDRFLRDVEATIGNEVRKTGVDRGIKVESIKLTEIRPDESAISKQWLELWQARLQRQLDGYHTRERMKRVQMTERARVGAKATFIKNMLEPFERLSTEATLKEISASLIITEFLDVLESMCGQGPEMQRLAFQQSESLIRIVNAIRQGSSPFSKPGIASQRQLPPDEET